ncbi:Glycosyltransferase Family 15 protein [Gigaspora rosea]|uniref:Glycosyltransferase Family 15 protein n=1 Tax=Gigaspora rosea TaxID=44941 RepID=A0A397V7Y6_9GLOM|nr:Glycosyltransferase Family 15 protein [Gigaspora rosea]
MILWFSLHFRTLLIRTIIIASIFTLSLYFIGVSILLEPPNSNLNDKALQSNTTVTHVDLTLTHAIDDNVNATLQQVNNTQIDDTKINDAKTDNTQVDDIQVDDIQSTQPNTQPNTQLDTQIIDDSQVNDPQVDNTKLKDTQVDNILVNNMQTDTQLNDMKAGNVQYNDTQAGTPLNDTKAGDKVDKQLNNSTTNEIQLNNTQVNNTQDNVTFTQVDTRLNGVIIVLVRNSELHQLRKTMRSFEDRWNKMYNYPYVFLNDQNFTQEFKTMTTALTSAKTYYGLIPEYMWGYPPWIDQARAAETRKQMGFRHILYGDSESYRHMCRFNSGFFFRHELIEKYDYYWRLEPGVDYTCDIEYDTFKFIKENNITYGFTISLLELSDTIPTLWKTVIDFVYKYPQYIADNNFIRFISSDDMATYNGCHFWSNFEIGDLNFFRSEKYLKFFDFLDRAGGFYYERWGDAPIHSIALLLFLEKSKIHFFNDIGYSHPPFQHCPLNIEYHNSGRCFCDPANNFDDQLGSCMKDWLKT